MKRRLIYPLYAVCGVLAALPYAINSLWFLSWIALVPVLAAEFSGPHDAKRPYLFAYRRGFFFFYPYGIAVFFWFFEMYPLDFTGMSRPAALCVVLLGTLGLPLLQVVVWAFFFVATTFVRRRLSPSSGVWTILLSPAVWVALEWAQAQTWAGVPWGKLALGQVSFRAAIQSSSLFGPYFVSFVIVLFAALAALAIVSLRSKAGKRRFAVCLAAAALVFAGNALYGAVRISTYEVNGNQIKVAAVQGNIDSKEKWSDDLDRTLETYEELTLSAAGDGAELAVWPETAIPVRLEKGSYFTNRIERLCAESKIPILVGAFYYDDDSGLANATFLVDPESGLGDEHYTKRRLVPFGEFVPWRDLIMTVVPPLSELTIIGDDLAAGNSSAIMETEFGNIGSIICFDSIYETLARTSAADGAELLCVSTNDSWFGDSAAVYEHNAHSVLRAVENGRYVVRSANTGISSIISPTGEIVAELEPLVGGSVCGTVTMISETTLYTRIGDVIVILAYAAVAASIAASTVISRRRKRNGD